MVYISGTTTITGLGTIAAGARRTVKFAGALLLSYNVTSLILPGAASITTAANDTAEFLRLGSENWLCLRYSPASGTYARSNVIGTVSQSGGVPTGALQEYGSNYQGQFWKYACGHMVCTFDAAFAGGTAANGNIFKSLTVAIGAMPSNFIAAPSVVGNGYVQSTGGG